MKRDNLKSGSRRKGFATRAIHAPTPSRDPYGTLTQPIYMTSTFEFETAEQGGARFAGDEEGFIYTRLGNPTLNQLEEKLAILEGAEACLTTGSGMGAITCVFWTLLEAGDELLVDKTLYGCTFAYFRHGLSKFGVNVRHVDLTNPENLDQEIGPKTKFVYFETPANPNMRIVDIKRVCDIADAKGVRVIVDNTYATPYLQNPLDLGAFLVLHSATKYLGGHGDLMAGAVMGDKETIDEIRMVGMKDMTGAVLSPMNAFLINRGLKTLELRMDRHCQNAMQIAGFLDSRNNVRETGYPGLPSFPGYEVARKQMSQPGGMIAFELDGGLEAGINFLDKLQLCRIAVSLGDAETMIQHPASMTHSTYTPEERAQYGISDGLIRISAGLEDIEDILEDIEQALAVC
ncbi:methionine gamma-lyase [Emcibacter nanhaiensis]|uniref:L-methionine gamma-lyase n=2 Tax=Emcibacter nanhaiensis TaxID=1505037 RepID=A0A501PDB8_9PROT|nr:methionine gamma-lyase [Emcibacter nanhaiensis]